jgi:hypothetical protein
LGRKRGKRNSASFPAKAHPVKKSAGAKELA